MAPLISWKTVAGYVKLDMLFLSNNLARPTFVLKAQYISPIFSGLSEHLSKKNRPGKRDPKSTIISAKVLKVILHWKLSFHLPFNFLIIQ